MGRREGYSNYTALPNYVSSGSIYITKCFAKEIPYCHNKIIKLIAPINTPQTHCSPSFQNTNVTSANLTVPILMKFSQ